MLFGSARSCSAGLACPSGRWDLVDIAQSFDLLISISYNKLLVVFINLNSWQVMASDDNITTAVDVYVPEIALLLCQSTCSKC